MPDEGDLEGSFGVVGFAFASLGRVFLCVNHEFRVLHASTHLDEVAGVGASRRVTGVFLADLLGDDLFGSAGTLRQLLLAGERREGWRATIRVPGFSPRLVSLSAAPFLWQGGGTCNSRVAYVIVLRPAEMDGPITLPPLPGLVGRSAAMEGIFRNVLNLDGSLATILFTGEKGTGKALLARTLHDRSPRRAGPFVVLACGSLPEETLSIELFGHLRGAIAGSQRGRIGRIQAASGGTLLLEEVDRLPKGLQDRLLAMLQKGSFERNGSPSPVQADVRIMAAAERDLRQAVEEGRFLEALFYRLNVVPMEIPPLRERREDIEPLATFLLAREGARQGRALRFSPDALRRLLDHQWPGNVREMESVLEYAVAVCRGQTVLPEDLPAEIRNEPFPVRLVIPPPVTDGEAKDRPGRDQLVRVLEAARWRRSEAAKTLGISRTTLWRRMREVGLD